MNNYEKVMRTVEVTPEMRERLLRNIENADMEEKPKIVKFYGIRQLAVAAACLVIVVGAVIGGQKLIAPSGNGGNPPDAMVSPEIVDFTSAEDLNAVLDFEIADIDWIKQTATESIYTSLNKEIGQIKYETADNVFYYRMSVGTEDNSGDYNEYTVAETETRDGIQYTIKGYDEGYQLLTWTDGTYSYSLGCDNPVPKEDIFTR